MMNDNEILSQRLGPLPTVCLTLVATGAASLAKLAELITLRTTASVPHKKISRTLNVSLSITANPFRSIAITLKSLNSYTARISFEFQEFMTKTLRALIPDSQFF